MFPYFEAIEVFIVLSWLFESYLDWRQRQRLFNRTKVPVELADHIKLETFAKSQEYSLTTNTWGFFVSAYNLVHSLLSLAFFARAWGWAKILAMLLRLPHADSEMVTSLTFASLLYLESTLVTIPLSLYSNFVIEERFGFNKLTLKLYFMDLMKSIALASVLGIPITALVIWTINWGGNNFWIYVWGLLFVISLLMITIYPIFIAPLFNKFTPLEEGPLRDAVYALADRLKFPLTKLYVMDASTRSAHSNAYFYGFFKSKRIVLYDTLLKQVSNDGVIAILAHELGHWSYNHMVKGLVLAQLHIALFLYVFNSGIHNAELFHSFGFTNEKPVLIGLALFSFVYSPVESVISFLMNVISRRHEYQADEFATKLGYDLSEPLARIHAENLSQMDPDPLYSAYHYSHPSLIERLRHIALLKKQKRT